MARNAVTIQFAPSPIAESILLLEDQLPDDSLFTSLASEVSRAAEALREADETLAEILESLGDSDAVELEGFSELEDDIEYSVDLEAGHVKFGLRELAATRHGQRHAQRVQRLLEWFEARPYWDVTLYFGGRRSTFAELRAVLNRVAPRPGRRETPRGRSRRDQAPPPEDEPVRGNDNRGGFGGFDGAQPQTATPARPQLSDEAVWFLQLSDVSWPCAEGDLKRAFRALALKMHPDRNPGNQHAGAVFARMMCGYEELRAAARPAAS